jgi:hypothetical protein
MVFDIKGGMFGRKRDELMAGWRKLHSKELHDLYSSPSTD